MDDTQTHVEHSKNDGHLHLDVVSNSQFVLFGDRPSRILSERVNASVVDLGIVFLPVVTLSKSFKVERTVFVLSQLGSQYIRLGHRLQSSK